MSSPKKSNKSVSQAVSSGRGAVSKAATGREKMNTSDTKAKASKGSTSKSTTSKTSAGKTAVKPAAAAVKSKIAAKTAATPVKSSKPAAAGKAGNKNNKIETAAKAKINGSKTPQKAQPVKASAKPVQSARTAPAASAPPKHTAGGVKAGGVAKAAGTAKSGAVSGNNQSGASKTPIVTNKSKATQKVTPAVAGKTKDAGAAKAAPVKAAAKSAVAAKPVAAQPASAQPAAAVKPAVAAKPVVTAKPVAATKPVLAVANAPEKVAPAAAANPAPVAAAKPAPVAAPAPAAIRPNVPYRPIVTPAMARPVTKPGVPHAGFKAGEYIVYPAHGVGKIVAIEEQEVAGFKLELFVIDFVKDKMTLKVPMPKVLAGAIRKLSSPEAVKKALDTLAGRARIKRTMWSRRAQEYEAKINSGDLVTIAEVVRDLYRSEAQPEQSYSERQLYEAAVDRMAREVAAVQKLTESESLKLIEQNLQRGPRRGAKTEAEAGAEDVAEAGAVDEAA